VLKSRRAEIGRVQGPGTKKSGKRREPEKAITQAKMQVRVVGLALLVAVFFVILGFRLWYLQVLSGNEYENSAQATQTRSVKMPAQRGVIYDRNGTVLANNQPGLNVTIIPNAIPREKVEKLADFLDTDKQAVLQNYDAAIASGNQYSPMLIKENATREDVMYVSERTEEFDGLMVNDDYIRNYPKGEVASHVLGYTGAITDAELETEAFAGLPNDSVIGKGGVELAYEDVLRGEQGYKEYNVDALGRQVALRKADGRRYDEQPEEIPEQGQPASVKEPVPGKDVRLTIDLKLQETVEQELDAAIARAQSMGSSGTGGAVVAMDPRDGQIVAMASRPTFDPQMFVGGITGSEELQRYEFLNSEEAHAPFTNRAIQGAYPGASTFKPFTGMAGMEQGTIGPGTTVTDNGECWRPTNSGWGCWQSWRENSPKYQFLGPHGTQNYAQALGDSNDKFFYQVADWMWNRTDDQNLLPEYYQQFGFGSPTGVDLPGESAGQVPTREWQEEVGATPDDKMWSVGRWVNISIGQGDLLLTPLQLIRGFAGIANGGSLVSPHVGLSLRDQSSGSEENITPKPQGSLGVSDLTLQTTLRGLRMVTASGGTAENAFRGATLPIIGKTGTGEMGEHRDPVNYFVGWAENQDDPLVVLVMIEGGGAFQTGSEVTAAPAARAILESYHGASGSSRNRSSADYAAEVARANRGEGTPEGPAGGGTAPTAAPRGVPPG
jgi:penicillin-binding protein 2